MVGYFECQYHRLKQSLVSLGVPGLRTVGSLDPFRLSKLRIAQRVPPNLDVQVGLRNMSTYGLSQIEVLNTT